MRNKGRMGSQHKIGLPFVKVVEKGDDKGLIFTEQISVGTPIDGKESVFGRGDSYGVGKEDTVPEGIPAMGSAWHCDISNTTDMVITSATDVTVTLSSDEGSTTSLFGGATTGKYILLGSNYNFCGVKAKIDTEGVVEPGNMVVERLVETSTWDAVGVMATESDAPYTSHAHMISDSGTLSEQWRFGFDPLNPMNLPATWDKVTLTINGVAYTKYWTRIRLTANITSDPVMEQIKLHTDRFEINAEGSTEYFGSSRYLKDITIEKHANADKTPASANVKVGVGITEVRTGNRFVKNKEDGFILSGKVPDGLDTSIPVVVTVDWYAENATAGDVELKLDIIGAIEEDAFTYDGTTVAVSAGSSIVTVNNEQEVLKKSEFLVDVSSGLVGDKFYGSLYRDASAGNANDTYLAGIVIVGYRVTGYFWKP